MKLLITGGSGFLGVRIVQYYQNKYECIAPSHKELDISNAANCLEVLRQYTPDYVIHTAAISDMGACEADPEHSREINVTGVENLANACLAVGSNMIFMSSDQVYNGNQTTEPNKETDQCTPANVYGRQKLEAEQRLMNILPDAIALRLTWMYDLPTPQLDTKANFLTRIMDSVHKKEQITFSNEEYRGITYVNEVVANIEQLFEVPGGIYNFGSHVKNTTYMLARQVFRMLGEAELIEQLLIKQSDGNSRNLSMDSQKQLKNHIIFSENRMGIMKCLQDHNIIK